jgi:N-formylglutamate deformylase
MLDTGHDRYGITMTKRYTHTTFTPSTLQVETSRAGTLPLLVSVPHGGYTVPGALRPRVSLSFPDIFPDSDPCTRTIFGLQDDVACYHESDIARAIIDLNRSPDDLPPQNPDGVIKSHTILGAAVYHPGQHPCPSLIKELLQRYYFPYHRKLREDATRSDLLCGLDCHTMLEFEPGTLPTEETERPFICLSNLGDENGEGPAEDISCSPDLVTLFADCLRLTFPEEADNIVLNTPFKGGHISQAHSKELPWIQLELNRRAYLHEPWFDPETFAVVPNRLDVLRDKLLQALVLFCEMASSRQLTENYAGIPYQRADISSLFRS